MRLQKATRFALYATLELAAEPGRQRSSAEIAAKYGISLNHLAKVLRTLGRAGLVEAARGATGGYRFVGNPKRTTLLDVIRQFEEVEPILHGEREPGDTTPAGLALTRVLQEIEDTAHATLASITLETCLRIVAREHGGHDAETAPAAQ